MFCFPSDKVQHEIQRRRLINISRKKNETKPLFKVNRKFCGRSVVHLEEDLGEDGVKVEPLASARRSAWGMLYADDAGIVSKSAEGLAKMMTVILTAFEAAGVTRVRKENGDDAAADTQPGNPDFTARRRSSGPEVYADNAVSVPGRPCRRKRRHCARGETTDPTRMGMLQSIQAGAVRYGG